MTVALRRPSRWVLVLAVSSLGVTFLTMVGPSLAQRVTDLYEDHRELRADEITRGQQHFYDLATVVRNAARSPSVSGLQRGRFAAEELARMALPRWDTESGNVVHHLHLVMGRLALSAGDTDGAKCHLLEAGKTPGSPQLDDYGPDMTLAQEMLEHGESAVVLQYFEQCDKFWLRREKNRLSEWSAAVRAGRMPDFGANSGLTPRESLR
jgi:hypothetical protein